MKCVICRSNKTKLIYTEYNKTFGPLKNHYCSDCKVIFCKDMDNVISPDYIDIEISNEHIWLQSEHKIDAFIQFELILKSLNISPELLLDYGCGTGGFLRFITRQNKNIELYGIDFSQKEIESAIKLDKNSRYLVSSSLNTVLSKINLNNKTSIITAWDVLEHIRVPLEFGKQLDGFDYLYFSVPSAEFQKLKFAFYRFFSRRPYFMSHEHVTYFSRKSLRIYVKQLGFTVLKEINVSMYKRKNKSVKNFLRSITYKIFGFLGYSPQIAVFAKKSS